MRAVILGVGMLQYFPHGLPVNALFTAGAQGQKTQTNSNCLLIHELRQLGLFREFAVFKLL